MQRNLDAFRGEVFDLLILGGGITGAGVALDAALNGWRVGLIDKGDFGSGTSSASSKLVHGGLRYLEHGDFRLVYEALHERRRLLRNAPHLVQPLRFIIPFQRGARVPPWEWRLGLTLYDLLAGASNIHRSGPVPLRRLRREFPFLQADQVTGGAEYYDAQMDDARLCLEVIRTATLQRACTANYIEAIEFEQQGGQIQGVRVRDHLGGSEFSIRARQVLNATGPWVDRVRELAGDTSGPLLDQTKGVHLIAPHPGLEAAFLLLHPDDGRVFFVIPWTPGVPSPQRGAPTLATRILIGTTDTRTPESADALHVTPEDVEYLLRGYNRYFSPQLGPEEVRSSLVGLRPLIRARKNDPSSLSREFRLFASPTGLLSAAGGKYTTYRHMAEVITAAIARRLKRPYRNRTADFPLDGAPQEPWPEFVARQAPVLVRQYRLSEPAARHLLQRYGRRAAEVAAGVREQPELAQPVIPGEPDLRVEFGYQRAQEMALRPDDFLLRRTRLGLFRPELLRSPPAEVLALSSVK